MSNKPWTVFVLIFLVTVAVTGGSRMSTTIRGSHRITAITSLLPGPEGLTLAEVKPHERAAMDLYLWYLRQIATLAIVLALALPVFVETMEEWVAAT